MQVSYNTPTEQDAVQGLLSAARRVLCKFGFNDNGTLKDWSEWEDLQDAYDAVAKHFASDYKAGDSQ